MTSIGRPAAYDNNFGKEIKMARKEENLAENLNKLAGNSAGSGIKYVNRADKEKLDKDGFLKIFTTQLTHQDPLSPMDQKEMTAELAQMGALEQMTNMNSKLDKLAVNPKLQNQMVGVSLLGKEVTTNGTSVDFNGSSEGVDIPINLPTNGKNVSVRISDTKGQMIRQLEFENLPKGANNIRWDGKKEDDSLIGKGTYNVSVFGKDENMKSFLGETKVKGLVTGVKFSNGELVLNIDGTKQVLLKDIESLEEPRDNVAKKPEII